MTRNNDNNGNDNTGNGKPGKPSETIDIHGAVHAGEVTDDALAEALTTLETAGMFKVDAAMAQQCLVHFMAMLYDDDIAKEVASVLAERMNDPAMPLEFKVFIKDAQRQAARMVKFNEAADKDAVKGEDK